MRKSQLCSIILAGMLISSMYPAVSSAAADQQGNVEQFTQKNGKDTADSGNVGFINIRENGINLQASTSPYDMSGDSIGILKISPFQLTPEKREKQDTPSKAAESMIADLNVIQEAHQKADWTTARQGMRALYTKHPDIPMFGKWLAIYQNRDKEYKESLSTISNLRMAFPLDKEIQNSFVFDYYTLDDVRALGDMQTADKLLANMQNKVDAMKTGKTPDGTLESVAECKDSMNVFLAYQRFMLKKDATGEVDKKALDALWAQVPKWRQKRLDRYQGFDLSELGYIYGITYHRKDILNAYINQKANAFDPETIEKVKAAKRIIYDEK